MHLLYFFMIVQFRYFITIVLQFVIFFCYVKLKLKKYRNISTSIIIIVFQNIEIQLFLPLNLRNIMEDIANSVCNKSIFTRKSFSNF